ncbi:MAG: hypothetical protein OH319_00070 [Candidatus Parvarchaeota archaeon]|nr:hypothetical protein [Candidatus Jingweiarchaeum tengchongense]MCW1298457.1 hypothetical protein [Candidatus Jingweiarchaeum tengchongense]MCW1300549.1 hypothetical protein [Candidatus Jingweiarchaeum tengchongense]MCW1304976.1 hypothetical protein [Candidatus Jingweiarchaeum tengchongense]MCW1309299.1 hypothetical protein [Candidatus Jingweiarchaeum tengchongense]
MKFCIVTSQKDIAGTNIFNLFINKFGFSITDEIFDNMPVYKKKDTILLNCAEDIIYVDYLDKYFNPDVYIFASRHKSESEKSCLTIHTTGNWSEDVSHGGRVKELSIFHSVLAKKAFRKLILATRKIGIKKDVCLEVTHHGPTSLKKPMFFIEVGSDEKEWQNIVNCEIIASVIDETIKESEILEKGKVAIGFGGPHYAPTFSRIETEDEYTMGHICPRYNVQHIDEGMIEQMIKKTFPVAEIALIDWKGLKSDERTHLIKKIENVGIKYERV